MKLMAMKQALGMAQGLRGKGSKGSVELKTFKKDRWVSVCATGDAVRVAEGGYAAAEKDYPPGAEARKALREACRREFPRSNKLYVSQR